MKVSPKKQLNKLTPGKVYLVIGIEADFLRIIDETGEPYLYDSDDFEVIDVQTPEFWLCEFGDDGEKYSYPEEWAHSGYFEDYFDGLSEAKKVFEEVMKNKYAL